MSENWTYSLNLSKSFNWNLKALHELIHIIENLGFSLKSPYDNKILVFCNTESHSIDTTDNLIELIKENPCLLYIFKDDIDLFFSLPMFDNQLTKDFKYMDISIERVVVFSEDKFNINRDIEKLYIGLIDNFKPISGESHDEVFLELLINNLLTKKYDNFTDYWDNIVEEKNNLKKPPFLFWLNYFSNDYFDCLTSSQKSFLLNKSLEIIKLKDGLEIKFFKYPFDYRTSDGLIKMKEINKQWIDI